MRWFRKKRVTSSWLKGKKVLPEKSSFRRSLEMFIVASFLLIGILYAVLSGCRCFLHAYHRHIFRFYDQPLREIQFRTDGVLSPAILSPYIAISIGTDLMDVDIQSLRSRLQAMGQVRSVEIERCFHDQSLRIDIREERPFARVLLEENKTKEILWVSVSGKVFHGLGFTDAIYQTLPFLTGLRLQGGEKDTVYHFGSDVSAIHDFLKQCQQGYPEVYSQIRYLALEHWDPNGEARWSRIEVVTRSVKKIIFSPDYWEEQLQRLRYILDDEHMKKCFPIERIDLRSGQEVSVRLTHRRR
jgi:cell division septal protein FtsQ